MSNKLKIIYLTGGFPTPDNPIHGVFNEKAVNSLSSFADITVIHYRIFKPGRRIFTDVRKEKYRHIILCIPFIPFFETRLIFLNRFIFNFFTRVHCSRILHECNVLHASDGVLSIMASNYKDTYGFKLLAQFIGGDLNQEIPALINKRIVKNWQKNIDAVSFNSTSLKEKYDSYFKKPEIRKIIYRGVDLKKFTPAEKVLDPLSFYYLGGIPDYREFNTGRNTKGGLTLMKAWSLLDKTLTTENVELHYAGPDSYNELVKSWRNNLNHPRKVVLYGKVNPEQIPDFHRKHNICLIPSLEEGLPNVCLEAGATGNLIIASDTGGIPEVIDNEKSGILCPPGDEKELFNQLKRVINNPQIINEYGSLLRKMVEVKFNSESFGRNYYELYNDILKD